MKNTRITRIVHFVRRLYPDLKEHFYLELKYPYSAHYEREVVTVEFRDFPAEECCEANKCDYYTATADVLAQRYLGACHTKLWHANTMIPMPSRAIGDEVYAAVPEHIALIILKRNWEIAKTYREAAVLVAEEQRRNIRRGLEKANNQQDTK